MADGDGVVLVTVGETRARAIFHIHGSKQPLNVTLERDVIPVLTRAGWTRRTFVAGDALSIVVHPSRAGTPVGVCLNPCAVTVNGKALSAREP